MQATQLVTTFDGEGGSTNSMEITPQKDTGTQELYILNLYPSVQYQKVNYFGAERSHKRLFWTGRNWL